MKFVGHVWLMAKTWKADKSLSGKVWNEKTTSSIKM
jgi:hypothetical protein